MDVMYQVMDQMVKTAELPQSAPAKRGADQKQGKDNGDFDKMVRQKRQDVRGQKPAQDARKAPAETADDSVPDEQYVIAAAMVMQMQPLIEYVQPEAEAVLMDTDLPQLEITVETGLPQMETDFVQTGNVVQELEAFAQTDAETEVVPIRSFAEMADGSDALAESRSEEEATPEELPIETPVFSSVDAMPVKVAEPLSEPLALEQEDAAEDLAVRIESLLTDEIGTSRVELSLTPEHLGKITVEITHSSNGALHIMLGASTEKAMSLLGRHAEGLQHLLGAQSRPSVEIEVRQSSETPRQFLNPDDGNGQQQQHRQQQQQQEHRQQDERQTFDFIQQLRLGLVDVAAMSVR